MYSISVLRVFVGVVLPAKSSRNTSTRAVGRGYHIIVMGVIGVYTRAAESERE